MKFKFLSREEERVLIIRWQNDGDKRAGDKVIAAHIPFARKMARELKGYGLPMEDMEQEAIVGMYNALSKFDLSRSNRFSTVAYWYARAAIRDYVLRNFTIVRSGTSEKTKKAFFKGDRMSHVSLDFPLPSGDSWVDVLVDESPTPEQIVEEIIDSEKHRKDLKRALRKLSPRSRDIVRRRYLNNRTETLDVIATHYGISRERVRQIEEKALSVMKAELV